MSYLILFYNSSLGLIKTWARILHVLKPILFFGDEWLDFLTELHQLENGCSFVEGTLKDTNIK